MLIIIPMSGIGKRFVEAGYQAPKPLIEVDGKPIIEHVVNLFPGETNFFFICNETHLKTTSMRTVLERIAPNGRIFSIPNHKKGPVFAVSQIESFIPDDEEVIVNYCDFFADWDYDGFLKDTRERNADGAIPSYRGFHPHMIHDPNYAFIREDNRWFLEIKEKEPFTDTRMNEYASNGTYYFRTGKLVKTYFQQLMDQNVHLNGEFYVSLVYNLLYRDSYKISIFEIDHMCQWGTPQDLEEYKKWSSFFHNQAKLVSPSTTLSNTLFLMPMAGLGSRFQREGYTLPKPLIPVDGVPMITRAVQSFPNTDKKRFVCLQEHLDRYSIDKELLKEFPGAEIIVLDHLTEGQACTCDAGLDTVDESMQLLIGACDNGMYYDESAFLSLIQDNHCDGVVFAFRHHPGAKRHPEMYGWLDVDSQNRIKGVSVKKPLSETPFNDYGIVGSFYFKSVAMFREGLEQLKSADTRINNEFYVDSVVGACVELGYSMMVFEVDYYLCWGTPDDLRTYDYWQAFFRKGLT